MILEKSNAFIEFSLSMIYQAMVNFLEDLKPLPLTRERRLGIAVKHFGATAFTRKDYLKLFKTISTATASRDLKFALRKNYCPNVVKKLEQPIRES